MTVEERARELWQALAWLTDDERLSDNERTRGIADIERHLREQIEDCAKIPDKYNNWAMAEEIRALAGPTEQESKDNDS